MGLTTGFVVLLREVRYAFSPLRYWTVTMCQEASMGKINPEKRARAEAKRLKKLKRKEEEAARQKAKTAEDRKKDEGVE